jgi:hypothetical protein
LNLRVRFRGSSTVTVLRTKDPLPEIR